jgi:hypothetical protein
VADLPGPPLLVDSYRLIRSQLEHEDTQINQRLSWFLLSHSFLFTAFAVTVGNQGRLSESTLRHFPLLVVIPCLALCSSLLIAISIVAGVLAMRELRRAFSNCVGACADTGLPPIHGRKHLRGLGLVAPLSLPALFSSVWLFLLVRELT